MPSLPLRRFAFLIALAVCVSSSHRLLAQEADADDDGIVTIFSDDGTDPGDPDLDPTLIYANAAPVEPIVEKAAASGVAGQPFSLQIKATSSPTSYDAQGLPDGLSVDTATGVISGTPIRAGIYKIKTSATNAVGTGKRKLQLSIYQLPIAAVTIAKDKDALLTDKTATNGVFVVTRNGGDLGETLNVRYTVGGNGIGGVDYKALKGTVTIKAGQLTRKIPIIPVDKDGTGNRVVKITLETGNGYTLGSEADAKLKVRDQK